MADQDPKAERMPQKLFILNGILRGVVVPLGDQDLRIGFSPTCEVILIDDVESPAEVVVSPGKPGTFKFNCSAGPVHIGRRTLKAGKTRLVSGGVPVIIGNVEMTLSSSLVSADQSIQSYRRRSTGVKYAALIAFAIGTAGLLSNSSPSNLISAKPIFIAKNQSGTARMRSDLPVTAATALQQRLDAAGLRRLAAEADRQWVVKVTGKLRPSERESWIEAVKWFDRSYGKSAYLHSTLTSTADAITLPFLIKAVWLGSVPRLTLHDGSRPHIGDNLPGGWRLDVITKESIAISKDEATLVVPLPALHPACAVASPGRVMSGTSMKCG